MLRLTYSTMLVSVALALLLFGINPAKAAHGALQHTVTGVQLDVRNDWD